MWQLTLLISISSVAVVSGTWNYDRSDPTYGPNGWPSLPGSSCGGSSNSPIDLDTSLTGIGEPMLLSGWHTPKHWNISNKHYTVEFALASGDMTLAGGGLSSMYNLIHLNFHWGSSNAAGSEHTIAGRHYPMEIQSVHIKSGFNSISSALASNQSDALAATSAMFEIVSEDNPRLDRLIDAVRGIQNASVSSDMVELPSLFSLLPARPDGFWRYNGGLTTPGCNEQVVWTLLNITIGISANQMAVFRSLDTGNYGTELHRPVVPVGNRSVDYYKMG